VLVHVCLIIKPYSFQIVAIMKDANYKTTTTIVLNGSNGRPIHADDSDTRLIG